MRQAALRGRVDLEQVLSAIKRGVSSRVAKAAVDRVVARFNLEGRLHQIDRRAIYALVALEHDVLTFGSDMRACGFAVAATAALLDEPVPPPLVDVQHWVAHLRRAARQMGAALVRPA